MSSQNESMIDLQFDPESSQGVTQEVTTQPKFISVKVIVNFIWSGNLFLLALYVWSQHNLCKHGIFMNTFFFYSIEYLLPNNYSIYLSLK